jgi:hypothetical protein
VGVALRRGAGPEAAVGVACGGARGPEAVVGGAGFARGQGVGLAGVGGAEHRGTAWSIHFIGVCVVWS